MGPRKKNSKYFLPLMWQISCLVQLSKKTILFGKKCVLTWLQKFFTHKNALFDHLLSKKKTIQSSLVESHQHTTFLLGNINLFCVGKVLQICQNVRKIIAKNPFCCLQRLLADIRSFWVRPSCLLELFMILFLSERPCSQVRKSLHHAQIQDTLCQTQQRKPRT